MLTSCGLLDDFYQNGISFYPALPFWCIGYITQARFGEFLRGSCATPSLNLI